MLSCTECGHYLTPYKEYGGEVDNVVADQNICNNCGYWTGYLKISLRRVD